VSYLEVLELAAPETILVVTAIVVLGADALSLRQLELRWRLAIGAMLSCLGCLAAIGWMLSLPQSANLLEGTMVVDPLRSLVKVGLLALTILTLLLSTDTEFTPHAGEYFALILFATTGMMFLVSSEDILILFISLELTSLCLYVLTAFNKRSSQSAEAALKYFLFGSMSAAFTLFGLSLLYGLAGASGLAQIASTLHSPRLDPLLLLAIVMTVVGLGFKVAVAPFHLWAPDVYQGAPTPSAALIASGSKVAGFFILARVMMLGFKGAEGSGGWHAFEAGWVPALVFLASVSMVLGNLAALAQTSVRRLLAYSAIAHAGYLLLGIVAQGRAGVAALVYYALTYALTTLGAFGVVSVVEKSAGGDRLSDFAGLGRRSPGVAFCMLIFMLSLAGIPPLAGFFGKFYVFSSVLSGGAPALGLLWVVGLALAMSAVSLYYYLQVLKQIYVVREPPQSNPAPAGYATQIVLGITAFGVVILGCAPEWLVGRISTAIAASGL
jgi:NADH-quinone oxidoreductase subunit N